MARTRTVAVTAAAIALLAVPAADTAVARQPSRLGIQAAPAPDRSISWLELGDSFSSGEGIPDAGPPCARSQLAFAPAAARLLRQQRGWTVGPEIFVACSGDVATDLFNARASAAGIEARPSQLDWAHEAGLPPTGRSDIVSFSFGGNDIGFDDVIKSCLELPATWTAAVSGSYEGRRCAPVDGQSLVHGLSDRVDNLVSTGERSDDLGPVANRGSADVPLADLYRRVLEELLAENGVLVVVGYPRLFAPSRQWGEWRGGRCATVAAADADALGAAAEHFDEALRRATTDADPGGQRIVYVSRLGIFDGDGSGRSHALCGGQTEWLNRLTAGLNDPEIRFERSFHPNAPGHAATAEAIAADLDGRFSPAPTPTTAPSPEATSPPITSGGTFAIGDAFDSQCVVAWPTAPVRSSKGITMRMSCSGVPNQFLFVDVFHPDRDLEITPSTGRVGVHGEIVDVTESELGFRTLVVLADSIDL